MFANREIACVTSRSKKKKYDDHTCSPFGVDVPHDKHEITFIGR